MIWSFKGNQYLVTLHAIHKCKSLLHLRQSQTGSVMLRNVSFSLCACVCVCANVSEYVQTCVFLSETPGYVIQWEWGAGWYLWKQLQPGKIDSSPADWDPPVRRSMGGQTLSAPFPTCRWSPTTSLQWESAACKDHWVTLGKKMSLMQEAMDDPHLSPCFGLKMCVTMSLPTVQ